MSTTQFISDADNELFRKFDMCLRFLEKNERAAERVHREEWKYASEGRKRKPLPDVRERRGYSGGEFEVFRIAAELYDSDDSELDEATVQAFPAYAALEKSTEYKEWAMYRDYAAPQAKDETLVSRAHGFAMNARLRAALLSDAEHMYTDLVRPAADAILTKLRDFIFGPCDGFHQTCKAAFGELQDMMRVCKSMETYRAIMEAAK